MTPLANPRCVAAKSMKPPSPPNDAEQMSTQAMMDAISPFTVSTVKKKKRTSFARSPTSLQDPISPIGFPQRFTSVSTSPSPFSTPPPNIPPSIPHSKPSSSLSLASFSIAPNGTLTEVYQQDGQQPQAPYFEPENWDLDGAIEEAGTFLGSWDVEAEARKEGEASRSLGSRSGSGNGNGNKVRRGILATGR